jgi:DNA replication initiation complex subunit (GINS family)
MAEEEISYRFLRKVQQMEKSSPVLTDLQTSFYEDVKKYLSDLNSRLNGESDSKKIKLLEEEIANTNKIILGIYEHREKKIILAAISKARGGEPNLKNLLDVEQEFFESVSGLINNFRGSFLDGKKKPEKTKTEDLEDKYPKEEKVEKKTFTNNNNPVVRVTGDVPEFVGTDTKKYTLRKNDIVSMPEDMQKMLSKRGVVEKLDL